MRRSTASITLAACAATCGAQAQTSVTLYGVADGGLRMDHTNVGTLKAVYSGGESGSRWGLRGIEDLGGGWKASFILEQGFDLSDNAVQQGSIGGGASGGFGGSSTAPHGSTGSRFFSRISTVGLSTPYGDLRFGRDYNPLFRVQAAADPYGAGMVGLAGNVFTNNTARNDNAVYVYSPDLYGFKFLADYQLGESTTDNRPPATTGQAKRGNDRYGLGFTYANGPLFAGAAYEHIRSNLDTYRVKTWDVAVTYDFSIVKLHAIGWRTLNDNTNALASAGSTVRLMQNAYFVGATVPFGAFTFLGGYGREMDHSGSNVRGVELGRPRANFFSLGARYSLSKSTVLYASAAAFRLRNGPNGNPFQGFIGIGDASTVGMYNAGNLYDAAGRSNVDPYSVQVGVRKLF